jgi:hypothetical protein
MPNAQKNAEIFICKKCDFTCSRQSNYAKHIMTRKHAILTNTYIKNASIYSCDCGKEYKHRQSLNNHKKICTYVVEPDPETEPELKENIPVTQDKVIETMVKHMQKQDKMIDKLVERLEDANSQTKVINNYNTTNNFNLNMFLNDTCKNAMNITDFMESIKLTIADMDNLGKVGYVDAVSKVIVDGLNQLDIGERPIHCTDAKRNSLYLKNNDEWNKEAADMPNIKKVIKNITNKNQSKIYDWMDHNPAHKSLGTAKHREYMSIVGEAMGPTTDEEESTKFKSIINRVSSATIIDKQAPPPPIKSVMNVE